MNHQPLSPELESYFQHIFDDYNPDIHLSDDQIAAILDDSDASLIIAGAGTGKTTTMVAKVKYLVDMLHVDPHKILVMSYARKNVMELRDSINTRLSIPADIFTFHSLGYQYIRSIFPDHHCTVIDENRRREIFTAFLRDEIYPSDLQKFINAFDPHFNTGFGWFFGNFFKDNYAKYPTFDAYFAAYKADTISKIRDVSEALEAKINESINTDHPITIRGEFVKSAAEAKIANFLTRYGITYHYEQIYDEILPDHASYRPDFTLEIGSDIIYVEFFGIDEGTEPYAIAYAREREVKESHHREKGNRFIALEPKPGDGYLDDLERELRSYGYDLHPRSDRELYDILLDSNPLAEFFYLEAFFYRVIDAIQSSPDRADYDRIVREELSHFQTVLDMDLGFDDSREFAAYQYKWLKRFLKYYSHARFSRGIYEFDYSDLIYFARKYIERLDYRIFNYDYVLIDEYQDISFERYTLLQKTMERTRAKLIAIGDDWQSIYAFSGSQIEYMYNFQKYFPEARMLKIRQTFRNPQTLVNTAGEFIMRNPDQIKKSLISNKESRIASPIRFLPFTDAPQSPSSQSEIETLYREICRIHSQYPSESDGGKILILGRRNSDLNRLFNYTRQTDRGTSHLFRNELDTKITVIDDSGPDFQIDAMTIHKSKGLTYDWVFIIGLNERFPIKDYGQFWLIRLFKGEKTPERIEDAEERRVFYVALTRCTQCVTLLKNIDARHRSRFIDELEEIIRENDDFIYQ